MASLKILNDELLLESYYTAVHLGLEQDFLVILQDEIMRRGIEAHLMERNDQNNES